MRHTGDLQRRVVFSMGVDGRVVASNTIVAEERAAH